MNECKDCGKQLASGYLCDDCDTVEIKEVSHVSINRRELSVAGGTVDGWVAELDGTTGTAHGREQALKNLAENLWRQSL